MIGVSEKEKLSRIKEDIAESKVSIAKMECLVMSLRILLKESKERELNDIGRIAGTLI